MRAKDGDPQNIRSFMSEHEQGETKQSVEEVLSHAIFTTVPEAMFVRRTEVFDIKNRSVSVVRTTHFVLGDKIWDVVEERVEHPFPKLSLGIEWPSENPEEEPAEMGANLLQEVSEGVKELKTTILPQASIIKNTHELLGMAKRAVGYPKDTQINMLAGKELLGKWVTISIEGRDPDLQSVTIDIDSNPESVLSIEEGEPNYNIITIKSSVSDPDSSFIALARLGEDVETNSVYGNRLASALLTRLMPVEPTHYPLELIK